MTGLRARLRRGDPLITTFVLIPRVEIIELLAKAGFEGVILDLEHGPYQAGDLLPLVAAGRQAGLCLIVRPPALDEQAIGAALDIGADGILVPHVSDADAARAVVAGGRFPPDGDRSLNPFVRGAGYEAGPDFLTADNTRVALLAMVEGAEGVANLPAILAVPGLDAVFIGPMDLSGALGVPGQPEHPIVIEQVGEIMTTAAAAGVGVGIYAPGTDAASRWLSRGARLVAVTADVHMALEGFRSYRQRVGAGGRAA